MELLVLVLIGVVAWWLLSQRGSGRSAVRGASRPRIAAAELDASRRAAEEDVTRFGEELGRLDDEVATSTLDEPMTQDWQRALDSYEAAGRALGMVQHPQDVRHVTEALEDGRYAVACVRARRDGRPLPTRRPPCFFNPAHGPSTTDLDWAPPGGLERRVPVCAADADRLAQGAEPDVRTVPQGAGRVPYWNGGPAYGPYAQGYFAGYAGMVPAFLIGGLLASSWDGGDGFGDSGGSGGDGGGGDGSGGDSGGDGGGYDGGDAGGFDGGGFDLGGFDGGF